MCFCLIKGRRHFRINIFSIKERRSFHKSLIKIKITKGILLKQLKQKTKKKVWILFQLYGTVFSFIN